MEENKKYLISDYEKRLNFLCFNLMKNDRLIHENYLYKSGKKFLFFGSQIIIDQDSINTVKNFLPTFFESLSKSFFSINTKSKGDGLYEKFATIYLEPNVFKKINEIGFIGDNYKKNENTTRFSKNQKYSNIFEIITERVLSEFKQKMNKEGQDFSSFFLEEAVGTIEEGNAQKNVFYITTMDNGYKTKFDVLKGILGKSNFSLKLLDPWSDEFVNEKIIAEIENNSYFIVDLSLFGKNELKPNISFELGYAKALKKKIIVFCEEKDFQNYYKSNGFSDLGSSYFVNTYKEITKDLDNKVLNEAMEKFI
ncbi:hypothetical protein [Spiroplasma endosymbiont of Panorpa germanica]|uniref:hypothetical protein n=1 Tax=Spiroplasma endosymbiont of Panorpa germanica TaxID=3066314 RepID=UPI0030CB0685